MPACMGKPNWPQDPTPCPPGVTQITLVPLLAHRLEYLHQKQSRVTNEAERQVLEKQSREAETEAQDIR